MSKVRISQKVKGAIMRSLRGTVFYMKMNILQDFCICISAPLTGVEGGVKTLLVFDTSV